MKAKLRMIKDELRQRMHQPIPKQGRWLERVVRGYFNYHAVPTNAACTGRVPAPCHRPLAAHAAASQPKGSAHVGADDATGGRVASQTDHPPSLAKRTLRRHTPEVGAVCGKAARTVLCGGRVMKHASLPLLRRREFITLLGGAAVAWPLAARAQQAALRTIGYLSPRSPGFEEDVLLPAFRQGLSETGYLVGKDLTIEYRWAEGNPDRLPALAANLIHNNVKVIVTTGGPQPFRRLER